jgi:hypothetical protein
MQPGVNRKKMKEKSVLNITLAAYALLMVTIGCSPTASTRNTAAEHVEKDSTTFVWRGDTIIPYLQFTSEEIMDYPVGKQLPTFNLNDYKDERYLHFIDGKRVENKSKKKVFKKLNNDVIKSFEFIPAAEGIELYGPKVANGVVIIETKKEE